MKESIQKVTEEKIQKKSSFFISIRRDILVKFIQSYMNFSEDKVHYLTIYKVLDIDSRVSLAYLRNSFCKESDFVCEELLYAAHCLECGEECDLKQAKALYQWCNKNVLERLNFIFIYASIFLTRFTRNIRVHLCSIKLIKRYSGLLKILTKEAYRISHWINKEVYYQYAQDSVRMMNLVYEVRLYYKFLKIKNNTLDYDDLIIYTINILKKQQKFIWYLCKFNNRFDHILLDEAQDTSLLQWYIIQYLSQKFFLKSEHKNIECTLFIVGDKKQSIYSFQGANVCIFKKMSDFFIKKAPKNWFQIKLNLSYRSSLAILSFIDSVFKLEEVSNGLGLNVINYEAHQVKTAGCVEVWPLEQLKYIEKKKCLNYISPYKRLAYFISKKLKYWITIKKKFLSLGRSIIPRDIMILVQRRSKFFYYLIHELKVNGIPVSREDYFRLSDQLIIQDVLALLRFLLMQSDDKNLFQVLISPLFSLTYNFLYNIMISMG